MRDTGTHGPGQGVFTPEAEGGAEVAGGSREVPCDLCGSERWTPKYFLKKLNRRVVQCQVCDLVFVNPPAEAYLTFDSEDGEERQKKYEALLDLNLEKFGIGREEIYQQEVPWRILHFQDRVRQIQSFCPAGALLDVGCARGQFLASVPREHFQIFGVEPREKIAAEAQERLGGNIFCGTLKEAHLPDSHFDVVTLLNLIEHLPSPREMLQEVHRVLKPGGLLVVETPDMGSRWPRLLGHRWHALLVAEHHFFFSRATLTKLLNATGFDVVAIRPTYKLITLRFLFYRSAWYVGKRASDFFIHLMERVRLADSPIRFREPDAMLVFARKR